MATKERSQVEALQRQVLVLLTQEIKLKTTLTPSCLQENTVIRVNSGSSTSVLSQPPAWMSSPSKKNSIKSYKSVKCVKRVFAPSEKSSTLKPLTNSSVKSPSTVPKEDSFWLESEMKSKWPFKPIKRSMKVPLLTEWEKRSKMSSKEQINYLDKRVLKNKIVSWASKLTNSITTFWTCWLPKKSK